MIARFARVKRVVLITMKTGRDVLPRSRRIYGTDIMSDNGSLNRPVGTGIDVERGVIHDGMWARYSSQKFNTPFNYVRN